MKKEYLIYKLSDEVRNSCKIPKEAFQKYGVKRGLRNEDGTGELVGLILVMLWGIPAIRMVNFVLVTESCITEDMN